MLKSWSIEEKIWCDKITFPLFVLNQVQRGNINENSPQIKTHKSTSTKIKAHKCTGDLYAHLRKSQLIRNRLPLETYVHWSPSSSLSPLPWQAKAYSTLSALKPCISCSLAFYTPSTFYKVAHCHAVVTSCPTAITKLSLLNYRPKAPKDGTEDEMRELQGTAEINKPMAANSPVRMSWPAALLSVLGSS